jgi:hypothetical protein
VAVIVMVAERRCIKMPEKFHKWSPAEVQAGPEVRLDGSDGFDVTIKSVIGRVEFGSGDKSPYAAAFNVIAESQMQGEFEFPGADGDRVVVTVLRKN